MIYWTWSFNDDYVFFIIPWGFNHVLMGFDEIYHEPNIVWVSEHGDYRRIFHAMHQPSIGFHGMSWGFQQALAATQLGGFLISVNLSWIHVQCWLVDEKIACYRWILLVYAGIHIISQSVFVRHHNTPATCLKSWTQMWESDGFASPKQVTNGFWPSPIYTAQSPTHPI